MPESKRRNKDKPSRSATSSHPKPNPLWYNPVMFGLMIIGLLWIIVYYISQGALPVPAFGSGNIIAGFGIAIVGFLMTTRWR